MFQLHTHYKYDVKMFVVLAVCIVIFKHIDLFNLLIPVLLIRSTAGESSQKLLKMLLTMPIDRTLLVKSRYVYEALYLAILFCLLGVITYVKSPVDSTTIASAITALIILYNSFFAYTIANEFSSKKVTSTDFLIGLFPTAGLIIVHVILMGISVEGGNAWIIMMLPIPTVSFYILHRLYKRSIEQLIIKDFA